MPPNNSMQQTALRAAADAGRWVASQFALTWVELIVRPLRESRLALFLGVTENHVAYLNQRAAQQFVRREAR